MRITYVAKAKLTPLWELVKKCGSQQAASRLLGVKATEFGEWLSLKSYPREASGRERRGGPREELINNVALYCGATVEEIWPAELRAAIDESKIVREAERTIDVKPGTLLGHSSELPSAHRLLESQERGELIERTLKMLSYREREILKLRYGLGDGCEYTLDEVAEVLKVSRERVRQIESKAIRKLQTFVPSAMLADYSDGLSGE